jgi:SAM-dependent methyltransferase
VKDKQMNNRTVTRALEHDDIIARSLAAAVVDTFGYGKTLAVGHGCDLIANSLRRQGVPAQGWPLADNSVSADATFESVVVSGHLEKLSPPDLAKAVQSLKRLCLRGLLLDIRTDGDEGTPGFGNNPRQRAWWEEYFIDAGFRRHPLYYRINDYAALENDDSRILVPLEKRNSGHWENRLPRPIENDELLHRDMLLESGRRSDAHCIRYHEAAAYVRPGDTVLDIACGLGYGSHILWHCSAAERVIGVDSCPLTIARADHEYGVKGYVSFMTGDAECLKELADDSIDFIAGFETIEHVPNPNAYLDELHRVLKPAGRVMLSAPNNWADETGEDPNPYHYHVYTWDRLRSECRARFLLEQGMIQTAGGAQRLHHAPRQWQRIDPSEPLPRDAEWILLLCMKNPLEGAAVPYRETTWRLPAATDFSVAAFARDYDNPWLVRGMVAIGMRSTSFASLAAMRQAVLETAHPQSVDFGAALCGEVYASLSRAPQSATQYEELRAAIERYAGLGSPTPHQLRWQVSLLFAGGELALAHNDSANARKLFEACADRDVCQYSPLLGTKTLDALFRLSVIALGEGDFARAMDLLRRSIRETQRLVKGSWLNIIGESDHPLTFGLPECAQLLDKGGRAAYLLAAIERAGNRTALLAHESLSFFERCLGAAANDTGSKSGEPRLHIRISELEAQKADLVSEVARLRASVGELEARNASLVGEVRHLNLNAERLAAEVQAQHANAEEIATQVRIQSDLADQHSRRAAELASELAAIKRNPLRLLKRRK